MESRKIQKKPKSGLVLLLAILAVSMTSFNPDSPHSSQYGGRDIASAFTDEVQGFINIISQDHSTIPLEDNRGTVLFVVQEETDTGVSDPLAGPSTTGAVAKIVPQVQLSQEYIRSKMGGLTAVAGCDSCQNDLVQKLRSWPTSSQQVANISCLTLEENFFKKTDGSDLSPDEKQEKVRDRLSSCRSELQAAADNYLQEQLNASNDQIKKEQEEALMCNAQKEAVEGTGERRKKKAYIQCLIANIEQMTEEQRDEAIEIIEAQMKEWLEAEDARSMQAFGRVLNKMEGEHLEDLRSGLKEEAKEMVLGVLTKGDLDKFEDLAKAMPRRGYIRDLRKDLVEVHAAAEEVQKVSSRFNNAANRSHNIQTQARQMCERAHGQDTVTVEACIKANPSARAAFGALSSDMPNGLPQRYARFVEMKFQSLRRNINNSRKEEGGGGFLDDDDLGALKDLAQSYQSEHLQLPDSLLVEAGATGEPGQQPPWLAQFTAGNKRQSRQSGSSLSLPTWYRPNSGRGMRLSMSDLSNRISQNNCSTYSPGGISRANCSGVGSSSTGGASMPPPPAPRMGTRPPGRGSRRAVNPRSSTPTL